MHAANRKYVNEFILTGISQTKRRLSRRTRGYKHTIKIYLKEMRREDKDGNEMAQDMV
jgi:hypothetical protein